MKKEYTFTHTHKKEGEKMNAPTPTIKPGLASIPFVRASAACEANMKLTQTESHASRTNTNSGAQCCSIAPCIAFATPQPDHHIYISSVASFSQRRRHRRRASTAMRQRRRRRRRQRSGNAQTVFSMTAATVTQSDPQYM